MEIEEANNGHDLPHDLTCLEILSRLPIRCIYKFRCVSKQWYGLPSDAKFVQAQSDKSLHSSKIIIFSYKIEEYLSVLSFYSLDMAESGRETKILFTLPLFFDDYRMERSCDGLVCFSAVHREEVYLCNPSTNEFLQLPKVNFYRTAEYRPGKVAGFGFDELRKEYKVLFAFQSRVSRSSKCFLFTVGSIGGQWRQVADIPDQILDMQSACLNGVLYWVVGYPVGIVSFNFQDETYKVIPVPADLEFYMAAVGDPIDVYLKAIGGYLRLFTVLDGSDSGWWILRCWTQIDPINHGWASEFQNTFYTTSDSQKSHSPIPVDLKNDMVLVSSGEKLHMLAMKGDGDGDPEPVICGIPGEDDIYIPKSYEPEFVESWTSVGLPRLEYRSKNRDDIDGDKEMQEMVDAIVGE